MARYKDVRPGLNHVAAYQVAGIPFASGSINPDQLGDVQSATEGGPYRVKFPAVTKWIHIINHGQSSGQNLKVSFSKHGIVGQTTGSPAGSYDGAPAPGTCNFIVPHKGSTTPQHHQVTLQVKVTEIWVTGSGTAGSTFDVIAGLTNIATASAATTAGNSWSGSLGVG
jgi:hypothetical protein